MSYTKFCLFYTEPSVHKQHKISYAPRARQNQPRLLAFPELPSQRFSPESFGVRVRGSGVHDPRPRVAGTARRSICKERRAPIVLSPWPDTKIRCSDSWGQLSSQPNFLLGPRLRLTSAMHKNRQGCAWSILESSQSYQGRCKSY